MHLMVHKELTWELVYFHLHPLWKLGKISEWLQLPLKAGFGLSPKQGPSQQKRVYLDFVWGCWGVRDRWRYSLAWQKVSPPEWKSHQNKDSVSPPVCTSWYGTGATACTCLDLSFLPLPLLRALWISLLTSTWQSTAVTVCHISPT